MEATFLTGARVANPGGGAGSIPCVIQETEALVEEAGAKHWWLHGPYPPEEQQATRANFLARHAAGNLGWFMAHGGGFSQDELDLADGRRVTVHEPGLLLVDGPVSMTRLLTEGYDFSRWRLLHLSSCLLGELSLLGASKEVLGYLAVLTLLGCRRVVSATWELSDESVPQFSRFWLRALCRNIFCPGARPDSHAFAVAFREALAEFRAADPRFAHEIFWAPYTLYGLG